MLNIQLLGCDPRIRTRSYLLQDTCNDTTNAIFYRKNLQKGSMHVETLSSARLIQAVRHLTISGLWR
jgi:hypothetical protein